MGQCYPTRRKANMFAAIGLVNPKTSANVGAVLRAADCYGASFIAVEGVRGHATVSRTSTDTMKAYKRIPVVLAHSLFDSHPVGTIPVAIDRVDDAVSLVDFVHPKRAFYVFGPEDGTLGARHLSQCTHRVFVPTRGCMNLAATVNVVLYDRLAKSLLSNPPHSV